MEPDSLDTSFHSIPNRLRYYSVTTWNTNVHLEINEYVEKGWHLHDVKIYDIANTSYFLILFWRYDDEVSS